MTAIDDCGWNVFEPKCPMQECLGLDRVMPNRTLYSRAMDQATAGSRRIFTRVE